MPDRDVFKTLPQFFRPAARSLLRTARGEPHEDLPVAEVLNRVMAGGVPSLPGLLRLLEEREANLVQASFPDESFDWAAREELRRACWTPVNGWRDELLIQSAIAAQASVGYDAHHILRGFVMRALNFVLIEPKGGVKDQLAREGRVLDVRSLEERLSPLLGSTAYRMQRNPRFKRLGLAAADMGEVSLHGENLLCL